ncbi:MAG: hypothetical protein ACYTFQ_26760 [Planctomycetota bacterium]|jgi:hypothetical protein
MADSVGAATSKPTWVTLKSNGWTPPISRSRWARKVPRLGREGQYDLVAEQMKIIRCVDLRMVDISDFLIVNIDLDVHACGTYEETTTANRQKKPMLFHIEQGKRNTPDWLIAAVPHQLIFSKWADLKMYVRHVATAPIDQVEHLNRWYFFDFTGT